MYSEGRKRNEGRPVCFRSLFVLLGLVCDHAAFGDDWTGTWVFEAGRGIVTPGRLVLSEKDGEVEARLSDLPLGAVVAYNKLYLCPGQECVYYGIRDGDTLTITGNAMVSHEYIGEDQRELNHIVAKKVSAEKLRSLDKSIQGELERNNVRMTKLPLPPVREVADNGLARTPPMGWGNWVATNDKTVREIADAMVTGGFRDAGYVYLVIDSGWQGKRDAAGRIHPNENFPDMRALADYLHVRGLKLGVYSSPGPLDCTGRLGSHGYEKEDARTYAEWGVDYLKYDWCFTAKIYNPADAHVDVLYSPEPVQRALFQKMGEALLASGRPIVYSVSNYGRNSIENWAKKAGANLWRTTYDIANRYESLSSNGFEVSGRLGNAGPGAWNDPDNLQIGKGMTLDEDRSHMSLWAILAAPLLMSNDPRRVKPEIREILLNKEVISINQDALGIQGRRMSRIGTTEVWVKRLSDEAAAVGMFNRGQSKESVNIRWSDLGFGDRLRIRDIWNRVDLRYSGHDYQTEIPAHGVVLLRVQVDELPSTLHSTGK